MFSLSSELKEAKNKIDRADTKKFIQQIYELTVDVESLTEEELRLCHVKLHNALSYEEPFASLQEIKKLHDKVAKRMEHHPYVDALDD